MFFFSSRRRHTRCALVTGVQTCALPISGTGPTVATIASYATERRLSRRPEEFGEGAIEGIAAPESANNAAAQTAFVPTLALGIPGSPTMAVIIGARMIHGIIPGPKIGRARLNSSH